MALLSIEQRQQIFQVLGYGDYNTESIAKFQKDYLRAKDVDGIYGNNTDNALRHVYNVKRYCKNFTPQEFKCECGGRYCTGYPTYMKASQLSTIQSIRDHYGKPMTITCGMRCTGYNRVLKGSVANSRHLTGLACDYYIKGVTDTLANRKNSIAWIKSLPYHRFTYGNGINSNGGAPSAPYMGNALHTDCEDVAVTDSTPTKSKYSGELPTLPISVSTNYAEKLASNAESIAWALGTAEKKWKYATGSPTAGCKTAMKSRGYDSKVEYSDCGYFQNTAIYKTNGSKVKVLGGVSESFKAVDGFNIVINGTSVKQSQLKRGDIVRYKKSASSQHTLMYLGSGKIAEAGRKVRFGVIRKSTKYTGTKKNIQVLRIKEGTTTRGYLQKNDVNNEVGKMQAFLNWFGNYGLAVDNAFGSASENAVKAFQKAMGITQDGLWGNDCNKKAKEYER